MRRLARRRRRSCAAAATGPAPLSFAQERLWFLDRFQPGTSLYNIPSSMRLAGDFDAGALASAWRQLEARHESLRTTFAELDGQPSQAIRPVRDSGQLALVDLSAASAEAVRQLVPRLAQRVVTRPFDLARGPLYRVVLLRLGPAAHVLLFTIHHIVADDWSLDICFRELAALYAAIRAGLPSPLAPLAVQYADYAVWQRDWLSGEMLAQQMAWWREHLAGAPSALELPTDRPRPKVRTGRGAIRTGFSCGPEVMRAVSALSRRAGTTHFMTLLAAFELLLHRTTGQSDLVVGVPIANRGRGETETLIGLFLNTLALRSDLTGSPRVGELLRQVRDTTLAAYEHQDLPFEKLVAELQPQRDPSRTPLFQAMFVFLHAAEDEPGFAGIEAAPLPVASASAKFDLQFGLTWQGDPRHARAGELAGAIEYDRELFDAATIERLGSHWTTLLAAMAANPEAEIAALPLLSGAERHQLLVEWNATAASYPPRQSLQGAIAAQAARSPEAVAVVFAESALSYGELAARAGRLARRLRALGVGPDVPVGIAAERSLELVVGLLAILQAGGAYVPLDPSYPPDRLAFMLGELLAAGGSVLLTQRAFAASLPAPAGVRRQCRQRPRAVLHRIILDEAAAPPAGDAAAPGGSLRGRPPGLRHLYLGLDGAAQGSDEHPRRAS